MNTAGVSSRQSEESRIVATWLNRLRDLLSIDGYDCFRNSLRNVGLTPSDCSPTNQHLTQKHLDTVLLECRQRYPDITLRLFSQAEVLDLGLVGYAAINSDNIESAFRVLYQYHSLASDRYTDELLVEGDMARIVSIPLPMHEDDYQNICEDSFSGNWRALQLLLGPDADQSKISVHFEFRAPSYLETYHAIFGSRCHFGTEQSGLCFPSAWLGLPVHRGSGSLSEVYQAMCERVLGPDTASRDTPLQIRRLLLSRTGRKMYRLEEAADTLRLTPTQLRKRLYRTGTSYKQLVLETRMELGRHYLLDTDLSVQEIAYLLDYSSPAPFSRAFKAQFGLSPDYFRQSSAASHGTQMQSKGS